MFSLVLNDEQLALKFPVESEFFLSAIPVWELPANAWLVISFAEAVGLSAITSASMCGHILV